MTSLKRPGQSWASDDREADVAATLTARYTKALDNIKALRKERTAELKVDGERLKFLKADKDKAERVSDSTVQISKDSSEI